MFKKLAASVVKEILLLLRDRVGLSIVFIMPMVLVFVMTLIQDSAFKSLNERGIPIVFVNQDKDSLGIEIERGLRASNLCTIYDSINGMPATPQLANEAVNAGRFMLGIVIPENATNAIRKNVLTLVQQTIGTNEDESVLKPSASITDSLEITILIDPITKKSFVSTITSTLREFISAVKTKIMFQTFAAHIAEIIPDKNNSPNNAYAQTQIIKYKEVYASTNFGEFVPNAVQHNVPAWTIFAMFFIVMPMAGSLMKEKTEGSIFRLHTMPSSYLLLINGKIIVYVMVCIIQFVLMMMVGKFLLPLMGLPVLYAGSSWLGLIILTLATAFAATGYGVMVGTIASTEQQGAIMGALSILLLSAIGGVWVPTYVMPQTMRNLSGLSPLNWSLDGFYELFLRGGNAQSVITNCFKLFLFFIATMSVASIYNRKKKNV
jgi:ABC-2 type transport system permease protein